MSHFVSTALICTGDAGRSAGVKDLNYANLNIARIIGQHCVLGSAAKFSYNK